MRTWLRQDAHDDQGGPGTPT